MSLIEKIARAIVEYEIQTLGREMNSIDQAFARITVNHGWRYKVDLATAIIKAIDEHSADFLVLALQEHEGAVLDTSKD